MIRGILGLYWGYIRVIVEYSGVIMELEWDACGMLDGLSWFHMYSVPLLRKTLWMSRQRERMG